MLERIGNVKNVPAFIAGVKAKKEKLMGTIETNMRDNFRVVFYKVWKMIFSKIARI